MESASSCSKTDGTQALAHWAVGRAWPSRGMYPGSVFHVTVLCRPDQDSFYDVDVSASQFVSIRCRQRRLRGQLVRLSRGGWSKPPLWQQQRTGTVPLLGQGWRRPKIASAIWKSVSHCAVPMQQVGLQQLSRSLCSGFSAYTLTLAAAAFTSYSERSGKLSILSASFRRLETIPGCGP